MTQPDVSFQTSMIQLRPAHPSFRGGSPAGCWHINKQTGEISCCMKGDIHVRYMTVHPHSSPPVADSIWHSHSFNVGTAGAKIFTGPAAEEFGYQVQQATNHEGKWYEAADNAGVISSVTRAGILQIRPRSVAPRVGGDLE